MSICLQMRRDTAANWSVANPVLLPGEFGYDETNKLVKIGDGSRGWNELPPLWAPCDYLEKLRSSSSSSRRSSSSRSSSSTILSSASLQSSSSSFLFSSSTLPQSSSSVSSDVLGSLSSALSESSAALDSSSFSADLDSSSSLRSSSSGFFFSSSSSRRSSSSSQTPQIVITRQPYNNFTGTDADFSVTAYATTGTPVSYQWQAYKEVPSAPGTYSWQNLAGDTASTLTLSVQGALSRGIDINSFDVPLRVLFNSTGGLTATSNTAYWRNLTLRSLVASVALTSGQLNYVGVETISGTAYKVYNATGATELNATVLDVGAYNMDTSWFSGADTTLSLQISSNLSTWTTLQTFSSRGVPPVCSAAVTSPGFATTRWYRWLITDNWPYTTINGSLSASRNQFRYPVTQTAQFKILWSA